VSTQSPQRRWLRFSIRTLLVAVTVGCLWFGWQVQIVRERRKLMNWAMDHGGYVDSISDEHLDYRRAKPMSSDTYNQFFSIDEAAVSVIRPRITTIPWYRELLGDKPVVTIAYSRVWRGEDQARQIEKYFPEADIAFGPN
jgi:hypothetical protein